MLESDGYSIHEGVISDRGCDDLLSALEGDSIGRSKAGARHLMTFAPVAAVAGDDRMSDIARRALGGSAIPFRATLFEKSKEANWLVIWHQDTALPLVSAFDSPEWGPWSEKAGVKYAHAPGWALQRVVALRLHLDAATAENGPLRVIPGSHCHGVMSDDAIFELAKASSCVECLTPKGGIVAMRPLLVHSSPKATAADPRRILHIEYTDELELAPNIRLAIA